MTLKTDGSFKFSSQKYIFRKSDEERASFRPTYQQQAEPAFQVENFDNTINSHFDLPGEEDGGRANIDNDVRSQFHRQHSPRFVED